MCEYCKPYKENSVIWNNHKLYVNRVNEDYLLVDLDTLQNEKERKAKLIVESAIENKFSRGTIDINYCPMCGRRLV